MSSLTPWFVLSYPRSRTAWVSAFLTGCGVPCLHEGWKVAKSAADLRTYLGELKSATVCNSDCSNIFLLPEIMQEFTNAKFVLLKRDLGEVERSLYESYGKHDYAPLFRAYRRAFDSLTFPIDLTLDHASWGLDESTQLGRTVSGQPPPDWWVETMHGLLVQLTDEQIQKDTALAAHGGIMHITERMAQLWA